MRLIDADEAVKRIQEQIKELKNKKTRIEALPRKTKDEEKRRNNALDIVNNEMANKAELLMFIIYDCPEAGTKEKEQTQ